MQSVQFVPVSRHFGRDFFWLRPAIWPASAPLAHHMTSKWLNDANIGSFRNWRIHPRSRITLQEFPVIICNLFSCRIQTGPRVPWSTKCLSKPPASRYICSRGCLTARLGTPENRRNTKKTFHLQPSILSGNLAVSFGELYQLFAIRLVFQPSIFRCKLAGFVSGRV